MGNMGCIYLDDNAQGFIQMNYFEAYEFCWNLDAVLIEIRSEQQLAFLDQILSLYPYSSYPFWIGATDLFHEGQWTWTSSGKTVGSFIWDIGQPEGGISHNCANLNRFSHTAFDNPCEWNLYPLCQNLLRRCQCESGYWKNMDFIFVTKCKNYASFLYFSNQ